jgi:TMPIT-like protein
VCKVGDACSETSRWRVLELASGHSIAQYALHEGGQFWCTTTGTVCPAGQCTDIAGPVSCIPGASRASEPRMICYLLMLDRSRDLANCLQHLCRYQRKRMYTRIALGKNSAMDVVGGETSGMPGQLLVLLPGLFVLQAWQIFMGVDMALQTWQSVIDPEGWLVRFELPAVSLWPVLPRSCLWRIAFAPVCAYSHCTAFLWQYGSTTSTCATLSRVSTAPVVHTLAELQLERQEEQQQDDMLMQEMERHETDLRASRGIFVVGVMMIGMGVLNAFYTMRTVAAKQRAAAGKQRKAD